MIYDKPTEYHYLPPPGQYQQHHHQESVQQQHSPQHLPQQLLKEYGGGNTTTTTATTTTGASFLPSISHHTTPVYQHQVEASHLEQPMSSITHSNAQPYPYNYQQAQVQQQQHHSFYAPTSHGATYQYTPSRMQTTHLIYHHPRSMQAPTTTIPQIDEAHGHQWKTKDYSNLYRCMEPQIGLE